MNYVERNQEVVSDDGFLQRVHETVFVGLKKCPVCESPVKLKHLNIDEIPLEFQADYAEVADDFYIVQCPKCHTSTRPFPTIEEVAVEWNENLKIDR